MHRLYNMYSKLESTEEKFLMINKFYKKVEDFKKNDNILSGNINKKTHILNNALMVYNKSLNIYKDEYLEQYEDNNKEWKEKYDYKNFNDLTANKIFNIDLSWMHDPALYKQISQDVLARYIRNEDLPELLSIQSFLDNITNEYIKNDAQDNIKN